MAKAKLNRKTSRDPVKRGVVRKKSSASASGAKLQGRDLERAIEQFQSEPDDERAHQRWKKIETSVFGAQYED
jgi:hypothetical protein